MEQPDRHESWRGRSFSLDSSGSFGYRCGLRYDNWEIPVEKNLAMKKTAGHLALGLSTGVTVFAIVVPLIHLLAELVTLVGVELGVWENPVEVFIFLMTATITGVFPWGLWILLTDARKGNMFDEGHDVAKYLLAAIGGFLALLLLVCTRLQSIYAQYRWFITPALMVCAAALVQWRWRKVWRVPKSIGFRGVLDHALPLQRVS